MKAELICSRCEKPMALDHSCQVHRGRRIFLLGALAAPLAVRLPTIAPRLYMVDVVWTLDRTTGTLSSVTTTWSRSASPIDRVVKSEYRHFVDFYASSAR